MPNVMGQAEARLRADSLELLIRRIHLGQSEGLYLLLQAVAEAVLLLL
jgi:hypothetical protein